MTGMGLRTFPSPDGSTWTVWRVQSSGTVPGTPSEWLAFQNKDGTERFRLLEVPAGWEELSDARLDLLRRMADPVRLRTRHSPAGGTERIDEVQPRVVDP
jgi:hypothetical protein